ncbi:MAG: RsbRD N-terminal domain-containing protein [Deltaproteobacteria bacterium]|nr:RsbRD N-terminal domain-containing protein [Deltaproteobacteria bacterium]MBW2660659.1 RsbRD N-terminal domain-containing protein [Deltaproteobacteria bacterium]
MKLKELLEKRKSAIVKCWFDLAVEAYPSDTSQFLKKQKDPFANPVGATISQALKPLFDEILNKMDQKVIEACLDPIIRIRAVQPILSPSQATSFIFFLKKAIRKNLTKELKDIEIINDLLMFELKIDEVGLIAFDVFVKRREQIYKIKANDHLGRTFSAFKRAGLVTETIDKLQSL